MTTRTDVTVVWHVSPRAIFFDALPLTMQDLVDSVRKQEDTFQGMGQPHLLDASGKQDLGGGVSVGITVQLQDATVAFTAQYNVLSTGTATSTTSSIATGITLVDTGATFQADGVKRGDLVLNTTTQEHANVIDVPSENALFMTHLDNLPASGWTSSDAYDVFQEDIGKYQGGNLVAVDDLLAAIDPVMPTFGVFAQIERSSSATLASSGAGGDALTLAQFLAFQRKLRR